MTEPNVTAQPGTADEWREAQERAREAAEEERKRIALLPWGSWVAIDLDNGPARTAVRPACGGQNPAADRGSYGVYLQPSHRAEDGTPTAATVRLHDRATGVVHGVPLAALTRTDYRDPRDLEGA